jgi:hypothetical protein
LFATRRYELGAGWSSPVARQAHNLKVVGSNPTPATKLNNGLVAFRPKPFFIVSGWCPFLIQESKPLNVGHPLPFICTIVQILCTLRLHQSHGNFEFLGGSIWCNPGQIQTQTSIDARCTQPSIEDVSDIFKRFKAVSVTNVYATIFGFEIV